MPTGYTDTIYRGEEQTFPEFAMDCARNFGALIELRDSPKAEIPDRFEPPSYHQRKLEEAEIELERWRTMTDEEAAADLRRVQEQVIAARQESIDTAAERKARYQAMLAKVETWTPPTAQHQGLKDFMVQQLSESIRIDCSTSYLPKPPPDDIDAWRRDRTHHWRKEVVYHSEQYVEDCKRAEERTSWVRALRNSLDTSTG